MLTIEGDFFLFNFAYTEDYSMVWYHSLYFKNGRPFIFLEMYMGFLSIQRKLHWNSFEAKAFELFSLLLEWIWIL